MLSLLGKFQMSSLLENFLEGRRNFFGPKIFCRGGEKNFFSDREFFLEGGRRM
jgi:hypothetical protein